MGTGRTARLRFVAYGLGCAVWVIPVSYLKTGEQAVAGSKLLPTSQCV